MVVDKKAGQLILSQLRMFNEAVVLFGQSIEPAVLEGFDACVESFAEENDWNGEYEFASDENCWLAPKAWATNQGEEDLEFKAWFAIDCIDDNDDYWTAMFCDVATQGGRAGFFFCIDPSAFGGKNAWNACAKKIPQELISQLIELGFQNQNKGSFFLPVKLDSAALANSCSEYGEFTEDDDSFIPLHDALEKLKQAVPIFDKIMDSCTPASSTK